MIDSRTRGLTQIPPEPARLRWVTCSFLDFLTGGMDLARYNGPMSMEAPRTGFFEDPVEVRRVLEKLFELNLIGKRSNTSFDLYYAANRQDGNGGGMH